MVFVAEKERQRFEASGPSREGALNSLCAHETVNHVPFSPLAALSYCSSTTFTITRICLYIIIQIDNILRNPARIPIDLSKIDVKQILFKYP